jgi:ribonuclease BN (tRNA processing enzyme)
MPAVKLTVIGCSPAWPNPGGAHSGYLVQGTGSLLLDCGPGVLSAFRELSEWPELDAIAITHFHLDHWGDLVPWVWGSLYLSKGNPTRPELWVPAGGRAILEEFGGRFGFSDMFDRVFVLHEYTAGTPFEAAGFTIDAMRVPHYALESHGFRVTDGETILAYSGDSGPSDELAEVARDADLFLCEATLATSAGDGPGLRGHLCLEETQATFEASGAKRLIVIHRPSELSSEGFELAYDGMVVEL